MFYLVSIPIILIGLVFWLPYKQGKKKLAFTTSIILIALFGLSLASDNDILILFIYFPAGLFSLIFVTYWTLVNLKFKKAGKIIAIAFTSIALLPFIILALGDFLFFKSDAKNLLNENRIELHDNFKIKSNHVTGMRDLYQKFELEISINDKNRILQQIRHSDYFKDSVKEEYNLESEMGRRLSKKVFEDYEKRDYVRRESYEKLKEGYSPNYDVITLSKTNNILTFERFND